MLYRTRAFSIVNISQTSIVIHQHGINWLLPILVHTLSDKPSYTEGNVDIVQTSQLTGVMSTSSLKLSRYDDCVNRI